MAEDLVRNAGLLNGRAGGIISFAGLKRAMKRSLKTILPLLSSPMPLFASDHVTSEAVFGTHSK